MSLQNGKASDEQEKLALGKCLHFVVSQQKDYVRKSLIFSTRALLAVNEACFFKYFIRSRFLCRFQPQAPCMAGYAALPVIFHVLFTI